MIRVETVVLEDVKAGMRLAASVYDPAGKILLAKNAQLNQNMIASLSRRGIAHVQVEVEAFLSENDIALQKEQILGRIDHLFRKSGDAPLMVKLREKVLEYRLEAFK
jgi:hypothetical protein